MISPAMGTITVWEMFWIPSLRCLPHLPGYGSHLLIDRREHVIQTGLDKPDQDILYRFRNSLNDGVHLPLLLREQCCQLWNQGSSQQHDSGTSHQLFYVFYEKILARNEP